MQLLWNCNFQKNLKIFDNVNFWEGNALHLKTTFCHKTFDNAPPFLKFLSSTYGPNSTSYSAADITVPSLNTAENITCKCHLFLKYFLNNRNIQSVLYYILPVMTPHSSLQSYTNFPKIFSIAPSIYLTKQF